MNLGFIVRGNKILPGQTGPEMLEKLGKKVPLFPFTNTLWIVPSSSMATLQEQERLAWVGSSAADVGNEKQDAAHDEYPLGQPGEKKQPVDAFGATKKTDIAEIKLVRKLDLWIMVRFSPVKVPEVTSVISNLSVIAYALAHVLAQLPR